jgi:hypothetical protein
MRLAISHGDVVEMAVILNVMLADEVAQSARGRSSSVGGSRTRPGFRRSDHSFHNNADALRRSCHTRGREEAMLSVDAAHRSVPLSARILVAWRRQAGACGAAIGMVVFNVEPYRVGPDHNVARV